MIAKVADPWHLSEPPPSAQSFAPLPRPGGGFLEQILEASTSYGPRKGAFELTTALSRKWVFYVLTTLPSPMEEIEERIQCSREILGLKEDWDGEGASAIAEATWQRAVEFLRRNASILWTKYSVRVEQPSIVPVADGSIDLHWKVANRELLVNIPPDLKKRATYYGDNKRGWNIAEGELNTDAPNHWLFVWLTE